MNALEQAKEYMQTFERVDTGENSLTQAAIAYALIALVERLDMVIGNTEYGRVAIRTMRNGEDVLYPGKEN